jgi:hypothetical protein
LLAHLDFFLNEEMAQNMMTPLATSLLRFQLKKMFKNMVCILGLFGLATVLATFQKILGDFFPIHLVTLHSRVGSWVHIHNTSFSSLLINWHHKLECFELASLSSLVL